MGTQEPNLCEVPNAKISKFLFEVLHESFGTKVILVPNPKLFDFILGVVLNEHLRIEIMLSSESKNF